MYQESKKLKLCFTSDIHGYFYPTTYGDRQKKDLGLFQCVGGFHKDADTLVIDGGDILQGSAFAYYCRQKLQSPELIAEIMNDCGYDYYTLGNHDFNYGGEYQAAYRKANHGRCVCQNITDDAGNILYPYDIHTMKNGLCIGIVGIVTDYINVWEKEENLSGIIITDPFVAAKRALEDLKGQVDLTICVYHGGFECDLKTGKRLSETTENVGYRICKELDYDILLTGHQHMSVDGQMVYGTYVVQPLENAKEYHYIEVTLSEEGKEICSQKRSAKAGNDVPQGVACKEDHGAVLREKYSETERKVQQWLDGPIGHLSRELLPQDKAFMALHGSKIADFLNRVQLYFSKAQLSSVGLANDIAGFHREVSMRDIIATYPYPNTLVVCEITGKQLKRAMERSAEYFAIDESGKVQVAESFIVPKVEHYNYDYYMGVTYEIDPYQPIGSRIQNLSYKGRPLCGEERFTLCLNNYRFTGAGGYEVYRECRVVREINIEMTELIMEYFKQNEYVEISE